MPALSSFPADANMTAEAITCLFLTAISLTLFLRLWLAGRQLHLQLQLPGHAELLADPDRLRQLFHNLFENSLRYTDPGGTLRIRCRQTPQALELDWEDSAPGVTPEQQAHLFDRFYRADSSRRRAAGGSGLGLAICREIVLAHGGDILAEPSELGGLALHLTFPLRPT
jgi:two-component system sensor histidine kinase BaeS